MMYENANGLKAKLSTAAKNSDVEYVNFALPYTTFILFVIYEIIVVSPYLISLWCRISKHADAVYDQTIHDQAIIT